jgi:microcystin-dependent protein
VGTSRRYHLIGVPDDVEWAAIFWGALDELRFSSNFEQFGSITPDDTSSAFAALYDEYRMNNPLVGTIFPYVSNTLPTNALACSGQTLLKADYPELWAVMDAAWGVDSTHFVLPDLRARVIIGSSGAAPGTLTPKAMGATGGEESHTLSVAEMPTHAHTEIGVLPAIPTAAAGPVPAVPGGIANFTGNAGLSSAHNTLPPYQALRWAIWVK